MSNPSVTLYSVRVSSFIRGLCNTSLPVLQSIKKILLSFIDELLIFYSTDSILFWGIFGAGTHMHKDRTCN